MIEGLYLVLSVPICRCPLTLKRNPYICNVAINAQGDPLVSIVCDGCGIRTSKPLKLTTITLSSDVPPVKNVETAVHNRLNLILDGNGK